jgi:hypothetical protein
MAARLRANWGTGVVIVTADVNPGHLVSASVFADEHFQVPPTSSSDHLGVLRDILEGREVDTFVPMLNADFVSGLALSSVLPGCDFWTSELMVRLSASKHEASGWLRGLGLPVPPELDSASIDPAGVYFVKPNDGSGSIGATVMTGAQARSVEGSGFVVQPVCEPPEVTVDSFYDVATGNVRAIARERIETKSGVATKARVFESQQLAEMASTIGAALGQQGTICFQVMTFEGHHVITDLNLRPGGGTAMSVAAGIDVLSAAFACRWSEPYDGYLDRVLPEQGVFVTRQYSEFVMPMVN